MWPSFESTYKELKSTQGNVREGVLDDSFESTYKELKFEDLPLSFVPTKGFESTYKELKY